MTDLARLASVAAEWRMDVNETRETATSVLGFGTWRGLPVVLKVVREGGDEWLSGEIAASYGGRGMAKVFRHAPGACLTERLLPGTPLVGLVKRGSDDEATLAIIAVVGEMAAVKANVATGSARTAESFVSAFDACLARDDHGIKRDMLLRAAAQYRELCATQKSVRLLHGDLQHYNVLHDEARGWIAIDPKGVLAEVEFEIGAMLRNPVDLPHVFADASVIERRVELVSTRLGLDPLRILRWASAQGVLSAVWSFEDDGVVRSGHAGLALTQAIETILK